MLSRDDLKRVLRYEPATGEWFRIRFHGMRIEIGAFPTAEAAHEAYKETASRLHGEFANGG